jgi:hypothetical protein
MTGTPDIQVIVERTTDLVHGPWVPVSTNTLTDRSSGFVDPKPSTLAGNFYRFRTP